MGEDQFALALRLEHIMRQPLGAETRQAKLLAGLALQGRLHALAQVHMSAHGRVPLTGLDVLPRRALLQIQVAAAVEHVQVHHGMQQLAAAVALAARGGSHDIPVLVYHGKHFFLVVLSDCHHSLSFVRCTII